MSSSRHCICSAVSQSLHTIRCPSILNKYFRILKSEFASGDEDDHGVNETRGHACEIVAWRFLTQLSAVKLIDYLLHELPPVSFDHGSYDEAGTHADDEDAAESAALLSGRGPSAASTQGKTRDSSIAEDEPMSSFVGLNALEIAAVAGAKKFLSQRIVQKTVDDIWNGHIIFWESLSVHSKKKAKFYNKARADPYCRLRVPKYQKSFEALFFTLFLGLYYAVLVERNPQKITPVEVLLYIWIAAFAYDEFGEFRDAGISFYVADFWSLWDIGIIGIGVAYMVSSESFVCCLMSSLSDGHAMPAFHNERGRAGKTDSAIERQVANSLPKGLLAWRKIARLSPTYPLTYSLSKLYFCFLEYVLCYPLSHSLALW